MTEKRYDELIFANSNGHKLAAQKQLQWVWVAAVGALSATAATPKKTARFVKKDAHIMEANIFNINHKNKKI